MITVRKYLPEDCPVLADLFYNTVHAVNAKDYTPDQLNAWATGTVDLEQWNGNFQKTVTMVAEKGSVLVGFGNIDQTGFLDFLYVHKDYQRCGIATLLCDVLEKSVKPKSFTVCASITAKPFFEKRGYRVVKARQVVRRGVRLTNFSMEKQGS